MPTLPNIPTDPLARVWWTPARIAQGQAWLQRPENGWTLTGGVWTPPTEGGWQPGDDVLANAIAWVLTGITSYGHKALFSPGDPTNGDKWADYGLTNFFIPGTDSPPTPTLNPHDTGGTLPAGTYWFVLTYYDPATGYETAITAAASATTTGSTGSITVTSPPDGVGAQYRVYASTDPNGSNPAWVLQGTVNVGVNLIAGNPLVTIGPGPTGLGNELLSTGPDRYAVHKWLPALYGWLYHHPEFTDALKTQVRTRYLSYVQNYESSPYVQYLWQSYGGNYCHALMACHLLAAIVFYGEDPATCETLLQWFFLDDPANNQYGPWAYYVSFSNGGDYYAGQNAAPVEGPQYGVTLAGYLHLALQAASDAGRDVFNELPFFKQLPFATAHCLPNMLTRKRGVTDTNRFAWTWCDNEINGTYPWPSNFTGDGLLRTIDHWPTTLAAQVARYILTRDGYFPAEVWGAACDSGADGGLSDLSGLPLDYAAGNGAWIFARSGWGDPSVAIMLQFQAPNASGHNHCDLGNIGIWYGAGGVGEYLIRETGGYDNTIGPWYTLNAHCHNVPLINGLGEPDNNGAQPVPNGAATILRLQSAPNFFFAAVDLTPCYHSWIPGYDNSEVQQVVREVMLLRFAATPPVVLVMDRLTSVAATTPKSNIWHFPYDPGAQQTDGKTLHSVGQVHEVFAQTWTPHATPIRTDENTGSYSDPAIPQFAFEVADNSGNNPANILTTFYPRTQGGAANPITGVTDNGMSLTVTVGSHTMVIPKGAGTGNWSVDGVPVASTPMACSVDENGVVWS